MYNIFNWVKAAELIKINKAETVYAGMKEDWSCTADTIVLNGEMYNGTPFTTSDWATPSILIEDVFIPCYLKVDTKYDAKIWTHRAIQRFNYHKNIKEIYSKKFEITGNQDTFERIKSIAFFEGVELKCNIDRGWFTDTIKFKIKGSLDSIESATYQYKNLFGEYR